MYENQPYFNSIKVQLELLNILNKSHISFHFNSIKVQLELIVLDVATLG